jgi:signal transduction histidine kinase
MSLVTSLRALNLRTKVMVIFLVMTLVPLVVIGWFSLQTTEELIASMVVRQLENAAADKAAILERWLDERQADLKVMAGSAILQSMDPEQIAPYLELIREEYGVYRDLTVLSAAGEIIFSSQAGLGLANERLVVRDDLYMSGIAYHPAAGASFFYIAAPVYDASGQLQGTVYGSVGTDKIIAFILNISLGKTGECYLVNAQGRFLAHKDPSRILSENISQSDSFKNIFQKDYKRKTYLDYRGIEVLGTSRNVGGTDWHVVVEQDRAEAFASVKTLKLIIGLTEVLCIVSALMLTGIVSHHIIRPIRELSRYAGHITDARFDPTVLKTARLDEIGMLYRAFENMLSRLRERQNNLELEVVSKDARIKETDSKLLETRRMAERSEKFAAMGRMGAAVAHEIRTPLTSLKLFLESIQDQLSPSAEDQEDLGVAMAQIRRMEGTINRFLDFARPREPVFAAIDPAGLIADVLLMTKPLANRQECAVRAQTEANLPAVTGDRQLLIEALINLVVNALEASPDHGIIAISAASDRFDRDGVSVPCVRIDVRDNGQGISEERLAAIFEPFFTTKASGTGLGLPLVLHTIQSHGGIIRVNSEFRQGTVFSLFIPRAVEPGPAA